MARQAIRVVGLAAARWITGGKRRIGWWSDVKKPRGVPARPDSADDGFDLLIGQHAAGALSKRGHSSSLSSFRSNPADRGIIRDCQINRAGEPNCCSALALRTMTSRAVLLIESV